MQTLVGIAHTVHPDEKAWLLSEINHMHPNGRGFRRYQMVYVIRGDAIAEHRTDLGPAEKFNAPEFRIPSLMEHSVGELRDIADIQRLKDTFWENFVLEQQAESTLITDAQAFFEEAEAVKKRRSVVGPGITRQRSW